MRDKVKKKKKITGPAQKDTLVRTIKQLRVQNLNNFDGYKIQKNGNNFFHSRPKNKNKNYLPSFLSFLGFPFSMLFNNYDFSLD